MATANPAPPDQKRIAETVRNRLPSRAALVNLTPLAGDASNRRYFRLHLEGGRSVILMQLASPEAFKQSEEAVTGTAAITELPFINVLRQLQSVGLPVPALYHYDEAGGLLYLEDLGDTTLAEAAQKGSSEITRALYCEAIEVLARMHRQPVDTSKGWLAYTRGFDVPLLMWEFDHFLEYGVVARHGQPMAPDDARIVQETFERMAHAIAAAPRVFTHRDYHSRNLMVRSGTSRSSVAASSALGVIDFQDALLGPRTYDLASLLRDAYIALDETLVDELIALYIDRSGDRALGAGAAGFRRLFDLTSIQRNLKAAGRFVYIDRVKGNPKFLADIPRVLGYVRRNLEKYPELAPLRRHLVPYVPELQS
ncbi:MAG TPA: phosphotransferase [Nitrospirales bacterium]|nr:phosphotransferase [Nitrospirales bacterium]